MIWGSSCGMSSPIIIGLAGLPSGCGVGVSVGKGVGVRAGMAVVARGVGVAVGPGVSLDLQAASARLTARRIKKTLTGRFRV
jgi:hypothetical protein